MPSAGSRKPIAGRDLCSHTTLALILALGSTFVVLASFALHAYLPSTVELGVLCAWFGSHAVALGLFAWALFLGNRGGGIGGKATLGTYFTLLLGYGILAWWTLSKAT